MIRSFLAIGPLVPALALVVAAPGAASADGFPWKAFADRTDDWYRGEEAARVAANVLSHQTDRGDWPKNLDTSARPRVDARSAPRGTFDNGATIGEMRFLARVHDASGRPREREAFLEALDHLLAAQYPVGGWPQSHPPGKGYARHITFNDNTMVNILELLRDVARSDEFRFVDDPRRDAAGRAFARGIDCILRCQIRVGGRLTVWCAQHDEVTLEPRAARTYELPSLSGSESSGILMLLMSLEDPGPDVVRAVHAGARWYEASKLTGSRLVDTDEGAILMRDADAPPIWARFYEIETGSPFFCGRDGVKRYSLAEIEPERRDNYAWYGRWGKKVADRYARWRVGRDDGAEPSSVSPRD